jgi:hypothetical protein
MRFDASPPTLAEFRYSLQDAPPAGHISLGELSSVICDRRGAEALEQPTGQTAARRSIFLLSRCVRAAAARCCLGEIPIRSALSFQAVHVACRIAEGSPLGSLLANQGANRDPDGSESAVPTPSPLS